MTASAPFFAGFESARLHWNGHDTLPATDRRRDLVKAGALILAEIERLDRIQREAMVNGNSRRIQ